MVAKTASYLIKMFYYSKYEVLISYVTQYKRGVLYMKAVTFQGKKKMKMKKVPDPKIIEPTDAIIKITASGICG